MTTPRGCRNRRLLNAKRTLSVLVGALLLALAFTLRVQPAFAGNDVVGGCSSGILLQGALPQGAFDYRLGVTRFLPVATYAGRSRMATLTSAGVVQGSTRGGITQERDPMSVMLQDEEAWAFAGQVVVEWSTVSEHDIIGFNLDRRALPGDDQKRLNPTIIPVQFPGSPNGAYYRYLDVAVDAGTSYEYMIEVVGMTGVTYTSDPLVVTVPHFAVVPLIRR